MPNAPHRHKHKHHTRQIQHTQGPPKTKRKAAFILALIGGAVGALIAYISSNQSAAWIFTGVAIGAIAGYVFGHNIDKAVEKK
jgi:hypothetical protein